MTEWKMGLPLHGCPNCMVPVQGIRVVRYMRPSGQGRDEIFHCWVVPVE